MNDQELAELDLAVARAEGLDYYVHNDGAHRRIEGGSTPYQPTRDGAEAMRLVEKHKLHLGWHKGKEEWRCGQGSVVYYGQGPTPAIAICRAVVALQAGGDNKEGR